jgi:hypothetical protein
MSETVINEVSINGVDYVRKDSIKVNTVAETLDGLEYKIVRTYSAGVFAGYVKSRNGQEVTMTKARRLWYWNGANELSGLALNGTAKPLDCKFGPECDVLLLNAIEILAVNEAARKSLQGVAIWQK